MKRCTIILLLAFLLAPLATSAQKKDEVTGAMLIKTTKTKEVQPAPATDTPEPTSKDVVVAKPKKKLELKAIEIKKGFQSEASFAYSVLCNEDLINQLNFNYIGGYRFNHYFYAGIGTGLDFALSYNFKPLATQDDTRDIGWVADSKYYGKGDKFEYSSYDVYRTDLPVQKMSIPLYVHLRAYFMKTKWAPFLAFSAGMRISASKKLDIHNCRDYYSGYNHIVEIGNYIETRKYGAVTGMFEVMPGVSYQYNKDLNFNFQFGYATRSGHRWGNWHDQGYTIRRSWFHGLTMRFGVVF